MLKILLILYISEKRIKLYLKISLNKVFIFFCNKSKSLICKTIKCVLSITFFCMSPNVTYVRKKLHIYIFRTLVVAEYVMEGHFLR